jgi:hypothetical protein
MQNNLIGVIAETLAKFIQREWGGSRKKKTPELC